MPGARLMSGGSTIMRCVLTLYRGGPHPLNSPAQARENALPGRPMEPEISIFDHTDFGVGHFKRPQGINGMEYVLVVYPTKRPVYVDGELIGETNEVLRMDSGTHR